MILPDLWVHWARPGRASRLGMSPLERHSTFGTIARSVALDSRAHRAKPGLRHRFGRGAATCVSAAARMSCGRFPQKDSAAMLAAEVFGPAILLRFEGRGGVDPHVA